MFARETLSVDMKVTSCNGVGMIYDLIVGTLLLAGGYYRLLGTCMSVFFHLTNKVCGACFIAYYHYYSIILFPVLPLR